MDDLCAVHGPRQPLVQAHQVGHVSEAGRGGANSGAHAQGGAGQGGANGGWVRGAHFRVGAERGQAVGVMGQGIGWGTVQATGVTGVRLKRGGRKVGSVAGNLLQ